MQVPDHPVKHINTELRQEGAVIEDSPDEDEDADDDDGHENKPAPKKERVKKAKANIEATSDEESD